VLTEHFVTTLVVVVALAATTVPMLPATVGSPRPVAYQALVIVAPSSVLDARMAKAALTVFGHSVVMAATPEDVRDSHRG